MATLKRLIGLALTCLLATACSGTTVKESWVKPGHSGKIENVYLIGIAKDESYRRLFEGALNRQLSGQGVQAVSSHKNLPKDQEGNREKIIQAMTANGCDSVLLTKLVRKRKEKGPESPGYQVVKFSAIPIYQGSWYNGWGDYYSHSYSVVDIQPKPTETVTLTVESVLYDLKTQEMIWSAQLETVDELDIKKMFQDYVKKVTKNLKEKGLI